MKQKDQRFQTHIREPRWQQVLSVVVVLGGIGLWLALAFLGN